MPTVCFYVSIDTIAMMPAQALLNARRLKQMLFMAFFLICVYLFTYNGRIESGDTRTLFNATGSLVQYGDLQLDKTAWYNQPESLTDPRTFLLGQFDAEPLQIALAAPFFWAAEQLNGVGLVHAVWLLNIFICTAVAVVMFLYALALGYSEPMAIFAALVLGLTTIFWPYSKSFFREPLAALLILVTALSFERWRSYRFRDWKWLLVGIVSLVSALLAKDAIIIALPALLILLIPVIPISPHRSRQLHLSVTIFLIVVVIVLVLLFLSTLLMTPAALQAFYRPLSLTLRRSLNYMPLALHTYLFSIGGSVWATSPITLLAVPGLWLLYRRHQYRYLFTAILILLGFTFGYAFLRGVHWFGGLSWPPRFLIPIVPFLLIAALPFIERAFQQKRGWERGLVVALLLYGLWIQITAISLDWGAYNAALPPEAGGLGEWGGGLNVISYLRWVLIPTLWSRFPIDFAWVRTGTALWPLACFIGGGLAAVGLWRSLKEPTSAQFAPRRQWLPLAGLITALLVGIYLGLRLIFSDTFYLGDQSSLFNILPVIQASTQPDDVLLLANNNYEPFFLNYDKAAAPRVITMPDQPGEVSSPDEPPAVRSDNPDVLLLKNTIPFLFNLAAVHSRLWLLADAGPWIPSAIRPLERFMVTHFYPIRELSTDPPDPRIRLIEYSTVTAPDPFGFRGPDEVTDLRYGASIHLYGFTLPSGITYKAGDVLPLSLYWQTDELLPQNYTVAWFLADEGGNLVVQGTDYQPGWGFAPTSQWKPDVPVWDNRALRLPADIKPGTYHIWLRLYSVDPTGTLQLLPVTGQSVVEDTIGVLPIELEVVP